MLCAFAVLLFVSSLAIGSVSASYALAGTANNEQSIPAETYGDDRRNEAVSILIYTEFTDLDPGQEWDNTMSSMIGSLEGKFTYDNLTDYTQLGSVINEYDILLITEMENGNYTDADDIVGVWDSILPSFVENGGIVICMTFNPSAASRGSAARILNGTGLMELYNPETAYPTQMNLVEPNDALARNIPATYTSSSGTISFETTDGVVVVEDNSDSKAVVVHKTMGKGHVVLLGFDMYTTGNAAQDTLLQNAILLHRHVVFDNSHAQDIDIISGHALVANELPYQGFSVSSMNTFSAATLEACEILVISTCGTVYNTSELAIIDDFVNNGGGLFIVTDYSFWGNALDGLLNHFGFVRNESYYMTDSDDNVDDIWDFALYPENLNMHSTKVGVDIVEVYGSTGFIEMPESAVPLITTDTDNTTTWDGVDDANGVPIAAADIVGEGRIVVLGDNGPITDGDYDGDATANYNDADNELFTNNVFRWLAGAGIPEQTVVFDQSHNPSNWIHSTWNPLVNFLMFNGYNVEWMSTFSPTAYEDADAFVICDGTIDYNTTEIAYITEFVAEGGALLLWGDHSSFGAQIDPIGQEFGLYVNTTGTLLETDDYDTYNGYTIFEGDNIGDHPIMDGVDRIEVDLSNAFISIGSGSALISTDSDGTTTWNDGTPAINLPVYAVTTYNMGRVAFLTDVELGKVSDPDTDGFGDLYDSDNPIFLANVFTWLAENRAPTVEVITPNGGEVINGTITIEWDAVDFDSDPLTYDVFYSDNNGSDWTILDSGLTGLTLDWNTTLHDDGVGYMIRVEVSDGTLAAMDDSDAPFELDNFEDVIPGGGLDTTTIIIIIVAGAVVIIIIIIIMKKKK